MAENARYVWLGERRRSEALATLAGSALLLVTSRLEGGSNVVSEAIASRVPVLSTRIAGSVGVLGPAYPGFVEVGDAAALAAQILRAEEDRAFLAELEAGVERARGLVESSPRTGRVASACSRSSRDAPALLARRGWWSSRRDIQAHQRARPRTAAGVHARRRRASRSAALSPS